MKTKLDDVIERIAFLARDRSEAVRGEEAIKTYLVMPFLRGLGYDVFDPDQVYAGFREGEGRADFATLDDEGKVRMLVAVASNPEDLEAPRIRNLAIACEQDGDLALITNGRKFHFHAVRNGGMEIHPFLSFDASDSSISSDIFSNLLRDKYNPEAAERDATSVLLPALAMSALLDELKREESETLEIVAKKISPGDVISAPARSAARMAFEEAARAIEDSRRPETVEEEDDEDGEGAGRRVMTGDELAAYEIIKKIASRYVDEARIVARPAQSYGAILLDDSNRKTLCRLHFTAASTKHIGTFTGRKEVRYKIGGFANVVDFETQIEARLRELDPGAFALADRQRKEAEESGVRAAEPVSESQAPAREQEMLAGETSPEATTEHSNGVQAEENEDRNSSDDRKQSQSGQEE